MTDLLNVTQRKWQRDGTEFIGMRDKGASVAEISETTHCTTSYVRECIAFAEKYPITAADIEREQTKPWSEEERVKWGRSFGRLHATGMSVARIATDHEIPVKRVLGAMEAAEYDHTSDRPAAAPLVRARTPRTWTDHSPRAPWSYPDELTLRLAREGRAEIKAHWH